MSVGLIVRPHPQGNISFSSATTGLLVQQGQFETICVYFLCSATMFLEFWKRRQAEIAYEWDLLGYEDEEVGKHAVHVFL